MPRYAALLRGVSPMNAMRVSERFRRLSALFDEIVELPPVDREAAVLASCAGDRALETELRALLGADGRTGVHDFFAGVVSSALEGHPK